MPVNDEDARQQVFVDRLLEVRVLSTLEHDGAFALAAPLPLAHAGPPPFVCGGPVLFDDHSGSRTSASASPRLEDAGDLFDRQAPAHDDLDHVVADLPRQL